MNETEHNQGARELEEKLATGGLRFTSQRRCVFEVLRQDRDHPTAAEVFMRAKRAMPGISHATVYNCLHALVTCGLARKVQLERGAVRFCPNMEEHCHYHCDECGDVMDVALASDSPLIPRPKGFKIERYEIAVHGVCANCTEKRK